ncbi:MAG: hypothetical protein R3D70_05930 [Rhizobiaceae bacterium]
MEYAKLARTRCYHLFRDGIPFNVVDDVPEPISRSMLHGMLSFMFQVKGRETSHRKPPKDVKAPGFYRLYTRFLNFTTLYAPLLPTIVCEGKTDNIYLKAALQSRHALFPDLIESIGGEFRLKLKFFKYSRSSEVLQNLSGGTGELNVLVNDYENRMKGFSAPTDQPVIIIADSDKGSKTLFETVKRKTGLNVAPPHRFFHIHSNLYVVPIPPIAGQEETAIEDLFSNEVLEEKLDGKTFNRTNGPSDPVKEYTKATFATDVVVKKKATIDFSRFDPLLATINEVINDYAAKVAALKAAA